MGETGRRRGRLIVVSAPSGTGKSTLCTQLRALGDDLAVSVSHTTRTPRGAERDGVEYHFVDDPTFDRMQAAGDFLEWARVHGRRYGSSRANVEALQARGIDVLFDIDVQGGFQIKRVEPGARLVFVLPPSLPELLRRLRERRTEDEEQVRARMRASLWELELGRGYDSFVINDDLSRALEALGEIRRSEATPGGDPGGREHLESLIRQGASMALAY